MEDCDDVNEISKGSPVINVLKEEWKNLYGMKKTFIWYSTFFVIAGIISLLNPLVIGLIFNSIQENITSQAELRKLIMLISLLFVITLSQEIFHASDRIMEQKTGFLVGRNYNANKIKKILDLPMTWHKDHHSGDTIDKLKKGTGSITNFSQHFTFSIVYALINLLGSVIILIFFDVTAAITALIFSSLTIYINNLI